MTALQFSRLIIHGLVLGSNENETYLAYKISYEFQFYLLTGPTGQTASQPRFQQFPSGDTSGPRHVADMPLGSAQVAGKKAFAPTQS